MKALLSIVAILVIFMSIASAWAQPAGYQT